MVKSTLAFNLAVAQANKDKMLLIDSDPQRSCESIMAIRKHFGYKNKFDFAKVLGKDLETEIEKLKNTKTHKHVIIYTRGRDTIKMRIALGKSDVVIIPVIPSQLDVYVLDFMMDVVKEALSEDINHNLKVFLLIGKVPTNPFLFKK